MKGKLVSNTDHYITSSQQITYIISRLEGKALGLIGPRVDSKELILGYSSYEDILTLL